MNKKCSKMSMQLIANWWFGIHDVAQEDIENIHCILASEKKHLIRTKKMRNQI
jgi:hypothetical protein